MLCPLPCMRCPCCALWRLWTCSVEVQQSTLSCLTRELNVTQFRGELPPRKGLCLCWSYRCHRKYPITTTPTARLSVLFIVYAPNAVFTMFNANKNSVSMRNILHRFIKPGQNVSPQPTSSTRSGTKKMDNINQKFNECKFKMIRRLGSNNDPYMYIRSFETESGI